MKSTSPQFQSVVILVFHRFHKLPRIIKKTAYNECYQKLGSSSNQVQIASKLIPSLGQTLLTVKGWESGFVVKGHKLFQPRRGNRVKIWKANSLPANVAYVAPNDNTPTVMHSRHISSCFYSHSLLAVVWSFFFSALFSHHCAASNVLI